MERETRTIKTPADKDLVLKTYLTARERNDLRKVFLDGMNIDPATKQVKEIPGGMLDVAEKKYIEIAVVSYDGQTNPDGIIESLLNAKPEEYDFVANEAAKIEGGMGFQPAK